MIRCLMGIDFKGVFPPYILQRADDNKNSHRWESIGQRGVFHVQLRGFKASASTRAAVAFSRNKTAETDSPTDGKNTEYMCMCYAFLFRIQKCNERSFQLLCPLLHLFLFQCLFERPCEPLDIDTQYLAAKRCKCFYSGLDLI